MEADGSDRSVDRSLDGPIDEALERELRQAIIERPDDDALRLVYADYWEEAGDLERAELMRLELELARDAGAPLSRERIAAEARRDKLDRNREIWYPEHSQLLLGYRRGMLERLEGPPAAFLEHGPALFADHPINALELDYYAPIAPETLGAIAACPALGSLRSLQLSIVADPDAILRLLVSPYLRSLRVLRLAAAPPPLLAAIGELPWPALEELHIDHVPFDDGKAIEALAAADIGPLRALGLQSVALRDDALRALAEGPLAAGFETLNLGQNDPLGAAGLAKLGASANGSTIRSLDLGDSPLEDPDIVPALAGGFPALERLAVTVDVPTAGPLSLLRQDLIGRLVELDLFASALEPGALAPFADIAAPRLRALRLGSSEIGDRDVEAICAAAMPELLELDLEGNGLTDAAVERIASWPAARRLVSLDLAESDVGDDGAAALAALGPGLARLSLRHTGITDAGVLALAEGGVFDQMVDLDLYNCDVSDTSLEPLLDRDRFPHLATVVVDRYRTSERCLRRLAEAFFLRD